MSGPVVFDASLLVKLVANEFGSEDALRLYVEAEAVHVPDWAMLETAHALCKKVRRSDIAADDATTAFAVLGSLDLTTHEAAALTSNALQLSLDSGHAVYDCLYVILAETLDAPIATADEAQRAIATQVLGSDGIVSLGT